MFVTVMSQESVTHFQADSSTTFPSDTILTTKDVYFNALGLMTTEEYDSK